MWKKSVIFKNKEKFFPLNGAILFLIQSKSFLLVLLQSLAVYVPVSCVNRFSTTFVASEGKIWRETSLVFFGGFNVLLYLLVLVILLFIFNKFWHFFNAYETILVYWAVFYFPLTRFSSLYTYNQNHCTVL